MTQFNVHTGTFANMLWNAVLLSEGPPGAPGYASILVSLEGSRLSMYGQGRYTAGVGRLDLEKNYGEATVCIDRDQARALQSAIRVFSSSKDSLLIVDMDEFGIEMDMITETGSTHTELVHMVVTFGNETVCAIPDSDPDARGATFWDHIDAVDAELPGSAAYCGPVALGIKSLSILGRLKPPVNRVGLRSTSNERVVAVKHGLYTVLVGTISQDEKDDDLWPVPVE